MIWDFPYDSPQAIIRLLSEHGYAMSKKFGQNFLISPSARNKIVDALELREAERVWEIGPGVGALTKLLLLQQVELTAFEIDHGFSAILREHAFRDESGFNLVEGDVLKTWTEIFREDGIPDAICGNLPYNIGSICIARMLEEQCTPKRMVFTLQKEVGDRLAASPGSKLWSTLSILSQIDYKVSQVCTIPSGSFFPPPQVDSVVILMQKRDTPLVKIEQRELFLTMTSDLFSQRRKTVRNNLLRGKLGLWYRKESLLDALNNAHILENERAERLDFNQLLTLSVAISHMDKVG